MDSEAFLCTLPKETLHAAELAFRANLNPLKPLQVSPLLTLLRRSHWRCDIFKGFQSGNLSPYFQSEFFIGTEKEEL